MKTALILSAGGMFGAYQAGVWSALQPVFRPDIVIGCSVGSINGWAIASDIPAAELIRTWLDPRCAALMTPRVPRRLLRGYFDPAPLVEMVRELTTSYQPRVPFALALTRLPRLRIEIVSSPDIDWRHIVASCAIPAGYPPVRIGGRLYCDGGLLSVLPAWAAAPFGVSHAIAVNVLPSVPLNLLRSGVRMLRLLAPREPRLEGVELLSLGPPRLMGKLHDAITWKPDALRAWIDRGRADAEDLIRSPRFAAIQGRFV